MLALGTVATRPREVETITGVYGSAIGMDSLNNTRVGGPDELSTSYRFRAVTTSELTSALIYIIGPGHAGYGAGTGGTWTVTVEADDGTSDHAPSGTALASTTLTPEDGLRLVRWPSPATLTAGRLYHVVFRNTDPRPGLNYASLDGVFMFHPTVPRQPAFSDLDWGQPLRAGSGPWSDRTGTVPIMQLNYADGMTSGLGYMEVWVRSYRRISGSAQVREAFTVSGPNRAVGSVHVRLMRVDGNSPLEVRLETSDGAPIVQGEVPASEIAIGVPGIDGSQDPTWASLTFASQQVLRSGASYNVVLSAPSDTSYAIVAVRKGVAYDFAPTTYFGDGHAQLTTGVGWGPFTQDGGGPLDEADLQFYFR